MRYFGEEKQIIFKLSFDKVSFIFPGGERESRIFVGEWVNAFNGDKIEMKDCFYHNCFLLRCANHFSLTF